VIDEAQVLAALPRDGFYREADEVWEPVWPASPPNSRERIVLRGLIQLVNVRLKSHMGRHRAAERLNAQARQEFANLNVGRGETFMGVDVNAVTPILDNQTS